MWRRCFLSLFLFVSSLEGAELAGWSASQPANSGGITLVKGPDADWSMERVDGIRVAAMTPVKDYYRRAAILLRVDKPIQHSVWLQIGYLDRGYGQITISQGANGSKSVAARDQWGIARLNSGKVRHAVFRIAAAGLRSWLDPT